MKKIENMIEINLVNLLKLSIGHDHRKYVVNRIIEMYFLSIH